MTVSFWDVIWAVVMMGALAAACVMGGMLLGAAFVLRAQSNGYTPLMPPLRDKDTAAVNMDDFTQEVGRQDQVVIDDLVEKIFAQRAAEDPNNPARNANARMKEQMNE